MNKELEKIFTQYKNGEISLDEYKNRSKLLAVQDNKYKQSSRRYFSAFYNRKEYFLTKLKCKQ